MAAGTRRSSHPTRRCAPRWRGEEAAARALARTPPDAAAARVFHACTLMARVRHRLLSSACSSSHRTLQFKVSGMKRAMTWRALSVFERHDAWRRFEKHAPPSKQALAVQGRRGCAGASREARGAFGNHRAAFQAAAARERCTTGLCCAHAARNTRRRTQRSARVALQALAPRRSHVEQAARRSCWAAAASARVHAPWGSFAPMQPNSPDSSATATRCAPCRRGSGARAAVPRLRALVCAFALALLRPVGAIYDTTFSNYFKVNTTGECCRSRLALPSALTFA